MRHFSIVLAGLVVFAVLILLLSLWIHYSQEREPGTAREAAKEERLQPVAGVHTEESQLAAIADEAEPEADAVAPEDIDGARTYRQVCAACHDAGVAGAPTLERETWGDRLDKDREQLIASVIDGMGAMPPRAGRPNLSDEEIAASVDYMLDEID